MEKTGIRYFSVLSLEELAGIKQTLEDLNGLVSHQNLVLNSMLAKSPPVLCQFLRKFIFLNNAANQNLNMIVGAVNQSLFEAIENLRNNQFARA